MSSSRLAERVKSMSEAEREAMRDLLTRVLAAMKAYEPEYVKQDAEYARRASVMSTVAKKPAT